MVFPRQFDALLFIFIETEFTDGGLQPYTIYEYRLTADNGYGSVLSSPVTYQTAPGIPSGNFTVIVISIGQTTATLSWSAPTSPNGIIQRYDITARTQLNGTGKILYSGLGLGKTLSDLQPYSRYFITVTWRCLLHLKGA